MFKNNFFKYILFVFVIISCNKTNKELIINHSEKGLKFNKVLLIQWKDTLNDNFVTLDSVVEMQFIGVKGFKLKDGKIFVGASMFVSDTLGTVLFRNDDIFIDYDTIGFEPKLVEERIGIFLETGEPMIKGKKYLWNTKIWDKNSNSELTAEVDIKIK